MSSRRIIILGIVVIILLLAVGSCRKAGTWLVNDSTPRHADVMVLLMGSIADRVLQVADLYEKGVSDRVWIVEEGMGPYKALEERGAHIISNTTQVKNALISLGIPARNITLLPGDATSSSMEARIVRDYLQKQPAVDTLLLVSSSAHTRRASMIFKAALDPLDHTPVVYCSPSHYTSFNAAKWWRSKNDIQRLVNEYLKMVNLVLFERKALRSTTG